VPARLCYEWDPATGDFAVVPDLKSRQFEEHGKTILEILRDRTESSEALNLKPGRFFRFMKCQETPAVSQNPQESLYSVASNIVKCSLTHGRGTPTKC